MWGRHIKSLASTDSLIKSIGNVMHYNLVTLVSGGPLRFWPKKRSVAALFFYPKTVVFGFLLHYAALQRF
jgi:hypothetical protein